MRLRSEFLNIDRFPRDDITKGQHAFEIYCALHPMEIVKDARIYRSIRCVSREEHEKLKNAFLLIDQVPCEEVNPGEQAFFIYEGFHPMAIIEEGESEPPERPNFEKTEYLPNETPKARFARITPYLERKRQEYMRVLNLYPYARLPGQGVVSADGKTHTFWARGKKKSTCKVVGVRKKKLS